MVEDNENKKRKSLFGPRKSTRKAPVTRSTEPAGKFGSGQNGDTDRDNHAPGDEPDQRVRKAEHCALGRGEVGRASDENTEAATQLSVRILQQVDLVECEGECRCKCD